MRSHPCKTGGSGERPLREGGQHESTVAKPGISTGQLNHAKRRLGGKDAMKSMPGQSWVLGQSGSGGRRRLWDATVSKRLEG